MSIKEETILCVKGEVSIYTRTYVMYTGFMTPNQLIEFADVPSFEKSDTHIKIAQNLDNDPVADWQRPMDSTRLEDIRMSVDSAIDKNDSKDSLMANPVLIGRSDLIPKEPKEDDTNILAEQYKIPAKKSKIEVTGVFELKMTKKDDAKPLWILDGQHRIHGLGQSPHPTNPKGVKIKKNGSLVADEVIPVVFVIDRSYNPKFLAKIFTEVTTQAQKMSSIHEDWMQYAFDMEPYHMPLQKTAMEVVMKLCKTQSIDSISNEFYDSIQFNPHNASFGVGSLKYSSAEFRKMIYDNYCLNLPIQLPKKGKNTSNPLRKAKPVDEIATAIVRFLRACVDLDPAHAIGKSKILSTNGSKFLTTEFFSAFLEFLAVTPTSVSKTYAEWIEFLDHPDRNFKGCDWEMEHVTAKSIETNIARRASKKAASISFQRFFKDPLSFGGEDVTDFIFGPDKIEIRTALDSKQFPNSPKKYTSLKVMANDGDLKINMRKDKHTQIKFVNIDHSVASISKMIFKDEGKEAIKITAGNAKTAIKLKSTGSKRTATFTVSTLCLAEESEKNLTVKVFY
jgi:hypothetical protein